MAETRPLADDDGSPVDRLAAEYLAAREAGQPVDLEPFLARLSTDAERAELKKLVHAADTGMRSSQILKVQAGLVLDGRYRLQKKLGEGGMGQVWAAHDANVDCVVAVKILNAAAASSLDPEASIQRETRLMSRIGHRGIATVHDFRRSDALTYFVMELVDGIPLSEVVEQARTHAVRPNGRELAAIIARPVPVGEDEVIGNESWYRSIARIFVEALRVLEAAHDKGIVHRDIKPSNIMLCGGGRPMILDFGLGRTIDATSGDITEGLYGTLYYVAPEQAASKQTGVDPRADVYQIGAVLYEMLTLERAVRGDTISTVLHNIAHGNFKRPRNVDPSLPKELEDVCMRAMEHQPTRRYATARAFREDLERFLDGTTLPVACRGSLARHARCFVRRNRTLVSIASVAVVAGLVGFLIAFSPRPVHAVEYGLQLTDPPESDGSRSARFTARLEATGAVDAFALIKIQRDGEEDRFLPLEPEDSNTGDRVELLGGTNSARWRTVVPGIKSGDRCTARLFAGKGEELAGLSRVWSELVLHVQEKGRPLPASDAKRFLSEIAQLSRSADGGRFEMPSPDTMLGDAPWRGGGERIETEVMEVK